jgi:hypothetical protein
MAALLSLTVTVYGSNGQGFTPTAMAFPTSSIMLRTIPATDYSGETCVSAIQLLPTGLNVNSPQFYVTQTVSELSDVINGL